MQSTAAPSRNTTATPAFLRCREPARRPSESAMRSSRSLARLCSRPSSLARVPRTAQTPVRRIHPELLHTRRPQSALAQHQAFLPQLCRHAFSTATKRSESAPVKQGDNSAAAEQQDIPQYQMTFTCKVCTTRSSHKVSKQGYHHGTVLISCPGCKNRHLISDHLKVRWRSALACPVQS